MKPEDVTDYLQIIISRAEIDSLDTSGSLNSLNQLLVSKETISSFQQRVDIGVFGYDDDPRELFEIPEVRHYIQQLDFYFPYWFYFLNNLSSSIQFVTYCCIGCSLVDGKLHFATSSMQNYLNSHFIRMNELCDLVGMNEDDNKSLTEMVLGSFQ